MALDGLLLHQIDQELQAKLPCRINKIQNISDVELLWTPAQRTADAAGCSSRCTAHTTASILPRQTIRRWNRRPIS